jgi:hypothetical protein
VRARRFLSLLGSSAVVLTLASVPGTAAAAPGDPPQPVPTDVREIDPDARYELSEDLQQAQKSAGASARVASTGETPAVGTVREWLALDDAESVLYLKEYTLKAVGDHIEVWVATGDPGDGIVGTEFPAGDCRTQVPNSTTVTTAQARSLAREFDTNMFPKESAAFSVPPDRDGSNALDIGVPVDFTGDGDKIVTLVDNVRDDNFYEFPENPTYIAGFFSSQFNDITDRNVMTIDAFDWLHRTGANPPNEPTDDLCTSRPERPRLYEGVFAHEYQHLLMNYTDPNEVNFINEGISDFAQTLVGYVDPALGVGQRGADSHIYCFQGWGPVKTPANSNPRNCGGPENSLTLWGDRGDGSEILADYGNAYSFQQFLFDRYGLEFISALHRDGENQGLDAVQAQLDQFAPGTDVFQLLHDFQVMNLVDRTVDVRAGTVTGDAKKAEVVAASLRQRLNLNNPAAYAFPGAAPNGADYVALRDKSGTFLRGQDLKSVSFNGAAQLPALPLQWTVADDAPGRAGNPTIWSGNESNLDAGAVVEVDVPADDPTLTFTELHLAESGFDYAYTMVSNDGGETYVPLANDNTTEGPLGPAFNGDAEDFAEQTFDLSEYAGQSVLVQFRYVSDGGVNDGGWYVDDVRVGGTLVSDGSDLSVFRSPTEVNPTEVANWDLRLVGLNHTGHKAHVEEFDGNRRFQVTASVLARFRAFPRVVAVVAYDDPTQQVQQYAPYRLYVNGVLQPGG